MPSEEDRATVTDNMHKNLVKFGCTVFKLCERIDRQAYVLFTTGLLRNPNGAR